MLSSSLVSNGSYAFIFIIGLSFFGMGLAEFYSVKYHPKPESLIIFWQRVKYPFKWFYLMLDGDSPDKANIVKYLSKPKYSSAILSLGFGTAILIGCMLMISKTLLNAITEGDYKITINYAVWMFLTLLGIYRTWFFTYRIKDM